MEDLDLPIALRRSQRCCARTPIKSEVPPGVLTPPETPRRKRGVRLSDPGSSILSSGLTPMVQRTYLATPKSRRSAAHIRNPGSTPRQSRHTALNLHQTVDGRVERRMRRNGLRDLIHKFEQEKRRKEQAAKAQIAKLKADVRARDNEIYDLQNATVIMDTERVWALERQVEELKDELSRNSVKEGVTQYYSWANSSSDASKDDLMDMNQDEDHFGNSTMLQLQASTPARGRSLFMTPPATSPRMPASPCFRAASPTPSSRDTPLCYPDSDKQLLEEEIASLHFEVHRLTATLDSYHALGARIGDALSNSPPERSRAFSTLEAVESQVQLLLQTMSERAAAASHLTSAISELGFPGDDASEMVSSLAAGFRAAHIELEYLTPGETSLPLISRGAQVLDLLLMRLRELTKKSKEDDESISECHEIEQSLRKQLDSRVSVMDELNEKITGVYRMLDEKDNRVRELEVGNERLKGAVDGYVRDIAELERLVARMENEHRESRRKSSDDLIVAKDTIIAELEAKIEDAVAQTAELLREMSATEVSLTRQTAAMSRQHRTALALRDARISELRCDIDRVNVSLQFAQETIHALRIENSEIKGQMEEERNKAKHAMDSMKDELRRVLRLSQSFLGEPSSDPSSRYSSNEPDTLRTVVRPGGFLENLGQRGSRILRRRYDSGLELLNEDDVDI
ncbi:N protein [Trichoderma simmonsii]|uniref:N protein n=1 Tax=Trichoderma simmonsii TaxID=1491479 RepID=A0A8G0L9Q0_9HYPO|nr:N protein [Trichoderma simmonsii]